MNAPVLTLTQALREPARPPLVEASDVATLIGEAERHRVLVLVGAALRAARTIDRWPPEFRRAFSVAERDAVALDCIRHRELTIVVAALDGAGVRALLFKGAALAQTHYAAPHLRCRTDTDLLIRAADLPGLERALDHLGYTPQHETTGDLVSYQRHYGKRDRHGVFHAIDVHWKVSNRHALADCLAFEELFVDRQALPAFGPSAFTVSTAHALLLALVHRAGHHPGSANLLWVWDLHALVTSMNDDELRLVADTIATRCLGRLASEGLALASAWFGTARLEGLVGVNAALAPDAGPTIASGSRAGVLRQDLRALSTWRERRQLVREHLFPPVSYIRGKYRARSALMVPALYAWRILSGAPRWLRRDGTG